MILTDKEIRAIDPGVYYNEINWARAIEAAVIAKLASGVSVEPVIRGWMNPMNGVVIDPQKKKQIGVGDGYPNFSVPLYKDSETVTRKQLRAAISAARCKAIEECAKAVEQQQTHGDHLGGWHEYFVGLIRKLKEST